MHEGAEQPWQHNDEGQPRLRTFAQRTDDPTVAEDGNSPLIPNAVPALHASVLPNIASARARHREMIELVLRNEFLCQAVQHHTYVNVQERYKEHILSRSYEPLWLKEGTRKIFFDLETLYLPNDEDLTFYPTGSTNYIAKQRLGTCVTIDDAGNVGCWDEQSVQALIQHLLSFDEVVSFNGIRFDNYVLSGYGGGKVLQDLTNRTLDLCLLVEVTTGKRRSLDQCLKEYLGKGKFKPTTATSSSKNVPHLLRTGDGEERARVWKYCFGDVHQMMQLYEKLDITLRKKSQFYTSFVDLVHSEIDAAATKSLWPPAPAPKDAAARWQDTGDRWNSTARTELHQVGTDRWNQLLSNIQQFLDSHPDQWFAWVHSILATHAFEQSRHTPYIQERRKISPQDLVISHLESILREAVPTYYRGALGIDSPCTENPSFLPSISEFSHSLSKLLVSHKQVIELAKGMNACTAIPLSIALETDAVSRVHTFQDDVAILQAASGAMVGMKDGVYKNDVSLLQGLMQKHSLDRIYHLAMTPNAKTELERRAIDHHFYPLSQEALLADSIVQPMQLSPHKEFTQWLLATVQESFPPIVRVHQTAKAAEARPSLESRLAVLEGIRTDATNMEWCKRVEQEKMTIQETLQAIEAILPTREHAAADVNVRNDDPFS